MQDVIQESLLRAARYRSRLHDDARLEAWVLRIAGNVLADHVRRECRFGRTTTGDEVLEGLPAPEPEPGAVEEGEGYRLGCWEVDERSALGHVSTAMDALRGGDRQVLTSFYHGAGSCRETAQSCGIARELVKVRLYRARKRLVRVLRHRISLDGETDLAEEPL